MVWLYFCLPLLAWWFSASVGAGGLRLWSVLMDLWCVIGLRVCLFWWLVIWLAGACCGFEFGFAVTRGWSVVFWFDSML